MTSYPFCELLQFAGAVGSVTQVHKQISPWLKKINYHLWLLQPRPEMSRNLSLGISCPFSTLYFVLGIEKTGNNPPLPTLHTFYKNALNKLQ